MFNEKISNSEQTIKARELKNGDVFAVKAMLDSLESVKDKFFLITDLSLHGTNQGIKGAEVEKIDGEWKYISGGKQISLCLDDVVSIIE